MTNNGIFISTKIKVLRNFKDYKFVSKFSLLDANNIIEKVSKLISTGFRFRRTSEIDERELNFLLKNELISKALIANNHFSAVGVNKDGNISIMLNEVDHIVTTATTSGLDASGLYESMKSTLDLIENGLSLAYDDEYGYLCASPTNIGSAMHISITMCLRGLTKLGELDRIVADLTQLGISVCAISQKNSQLFKIENTNCLGLNEQDIINKMQSVALKLQEYEMSARRLLYDADPVALTDTVRRAYGVLMNCYCLSYRELNELASQIRVGASLSLIDVKIPALDKAILDNSYEALYFKGEDVSNYEITLAKNIQKALKEN